MSAIDVLEKIAPNMLEKDENGNTMPRLTNKRLRSDEMRETLHVLGYSFALNLCGGIVEVNGKQIDDITSAIIYNKMRDHDFKSEKEIDNAIKAEAARNAYHPIKAYLNSLEWDGQDHIAILASKLHSDDPNVVYGDGTSASLTYVYLYRWMVGAVRKVFENEQNMMLVMAGEQGIGKSLFAHWLCSSIPDYFIEEPINPDDKDNRLRLMSKFIWEVAELDATTRKSDVSALKAFVTEKVVTVRRSYDKYDTTGYAMASLIGTVNNGTGFLVDDTGNRRFMVTNVTGIDWDYAKMDVDQVWATAMHLYRDCGATGALLPAERAIQANQNRKYRVESVLDGWIAKYFDCNAPLEETMSSADIALHLQQHCNISLRGTEKQQHMSIASALVNLGVDKKHFRTGWRYLGIKPITL